MMTGTVTKVRGRALAGAFRIIFSVDIHLSMERLGSAYGGWWVPANLLKPESVCYCGGVGTDISFDLALIKKYGCSVYGIDPTPQSLEWIKNQNIDSRFQMVPAGLGGDVGEVKFYVPTDATHISHSIKNLQGTNQYFVAQLQTVSGLMSELGHERLDLIKLDIEGAEHDAIKRMLADDIRPDVVCVEYDQPEPLAWARQTTSRLREAGYLLAKVEGFNLTFVQAQIANSLK